MFRRYNRWWSRFDQPDPYDGSYNLTNPQSFNRYAYVQNDPVNLIDPFGLDPIGALGTALGGGGSLGSALGGALGGQSLGPGTSVVNVPITDDAVFIATSFPDEILGPASLRLRGLQKPLDTSQTERLLTGDCVHFLNSILAELGKIVDPYSYNFLAIFRKAKDQRPLYTIRMTPEEMKRQRLAGGAHSIVGDPAFYIFLNEHLAYESGDNGYTLIHELFHGAAGSDTGYNHTQMATAAYYAAQANPAMMKELQKHGIKAPRNVIYTPGAYVETDDFYNADIFNRILRLGCP